MKLVVITPQSRTVIDKVDKVSLPGTKGRFMVLRGHAPLVSSMQKGVVMCDRQEFAIEGGIVEVKKEVITIITE